MNTGDRVKITGDDHPHHGSTGVIVYKFQPPSSLDWTVRIDTGQHAERDVAACENELRLEPRAT